MIDEYWTWIFYGYHSDELKPQSHKPIIAVCDDCRIYRVVQKRSYSEMCRLCSQKGERSAFYGKHHADESKLKMSISRTGEKNHMYGKHHTDETKRQMSKSTSGKNHPMYGKHHSDETRQKMCENSARISGEDHYMYGRKGKDAPNYGRHHTEEALLNMSIAQTGENNGNWKGGVTPWRIVLCSSIPYKNWRKAVFERDDYTCQMCVERGVYLEAHHILPVRDNKNTLLIFDIDNGITLCKKCHDKTKGREYEFVEQFESIIRGK